MESDSCPESRTRQHTIKPASYNRQIHASQTAKASHLVKRWDALMVSLQIKGLCLKLHRT